MKSWMLILMLLIGITTAGAQQNQQRKRPPFDPKRFEADMEQFITTNACLSPQEAAKFFPVYRQMMKKMRMLFDEMRRYHHVDMKDNEACLEAIRRQDEIDVEMKQLQQEYHSRFITILPPSKVLGVIKAEERFHRQAFKKMRP